MTLLFHFHAEISKMLKFWPEKVSKVSKSDLRNFEDNLYIKSYKSDFETQNQSKKTKINGVLNCF